MRILSNTCFDKIEALLYKFLELFLIDSTGSSLSKCSIGVKMFLKSSTDASSPKTSLAHSGPGYSMTHR